MSGIQRKISRVNYFDGQRVTESDLDTDQNYFRSLISNLTLDFHSSGIVQIDQLERYLFDSSDPGKYGENSSKSTIEAGLFDGKPINLDRQPSDLNYGNRLVFKLEGSESRGRESTKVLITGRVYNSLSSSDDIKTEIITLKRGQKVLTKNYYSKIYSIIFNNFSGGTGKNEFETSVVNKNNIESGGKLLVFESKPMEVFPYLINQEQNKSPNFEMMEFVSSSDTRSIKDEISDGLSSGVTIDQVFADFTIKEIVTLEKDANINKKFGQKFLSKNNNIQKVELYLSVEADSTLSDPYDWSGDLIFSIFPLDTTVEGCSSRIPNTLLDYDPESSPIVQISFDKEDLKDKGFDLGGDPTLVSIDFSHTNIAVPTSELIEKDKYYAVEVRRSGLNNVGTINLYKGYDNVVRKEELGIPLNPVEKFTNQETRFTQYDPTTKRYIDDVDSSLWFRVESSAVEITDGVCYSTEGLFVVNPKTYSFVGNNEVLFYKRHIDMPAVNGSTYYLTLEAIQEFSDADVHPRTGNVIYTRIQDIPGFKFLTSDEIANMTAREYPLVLASVADKNPRVTSSETKSFKYAGLYDTDYFYILNPTSEERDRKYIGSNFIPDTECHCKNIYKIIDVECKTVEYGDVNQDGVINSEDLSRLIDLSGNVINSEDTERRLFGDEFSIIEFELSDLNEDDMVDGFDIEILEDLIEGKDDRLTPNSLTYLKAYFENTIPREGSAQIFELTNNSTATSSGTDIVTFTCTDIKQPLSIRLGDTVTVTSGADQGDYEILTKSVDTTGLGVTLTVALQGGSVSFSGSTSTNVKLISQTKTNLFADNLDLISTPYSEKTYLLYQDNGVFNENNIDVCDLRRLIEISYVEIPSGLCECKDPKCDLVNCALKSQNDKFLPGNLLLSGRILDEYSNTHKLDYEFSTVKVPLPPGSLEDCKIDLYNSFVKAVDNDCKTIGGFPAMQYSDGTYVGCEDTEASTDLTKKRVKFQGGIASLHVDAFIETTVDGYADGYSPRPDFEKLKKEILSYEDLAQTFQDYSFFSFSSWGLSSIYNPGSTFGSVTNPSGLNEPATFSFTTQNVSGDKKFLLEKPTLQQDASGDFVIDFVSLRTNWTEEDLGSGNVFFSMEGEVVNLDSSLSLVSTGTFSVGIRKVGSSQREAFFKGQITDSVGAVIYDFNFGETLKDDLGDEITFRIRRNGDAISAYYHISKKIITELNQFERIGTNLDTHLGSGDMNFGFSIGQENSPVGAKSYSVKLQSFVLRNNFLSVEDDDTLVISKDASSNVERTIFNFPLTLSQRTNIIKAEMTLTATDSTIFNDTLYVVPLEVLDLRQVQAQENYPETTNESLFTPFIPGTVTAGDEIVVDISSIIISYLKNTAHISGYYKGLIIEASSGAVGSLSISSTVKIDLTYEDISSGVIIKVGMHLDAETGIASFKTKNVIFDKLIKENRTTIEFGIHLKKAGFSNKDIEVTLDQLRNIGIGTCFTNEELPADNECYFVTGATANGVFVEGPFPCVLKLNE